MRKSVAVLDYSKTEESGGGFRRWMRRHGYAALVSILAAMGFVTLIALGLSFGSRAFVGGINLFGLITVGLIAAAGVFGILKFTHRRRGRWWGMAKALILAEFVLAIELEILLSSHTINVSQGSGFFTIFIFTLCWFVLGSLFYLAAIGLDILFERVTEGNYKTALIGRYLRKRRIAWVALGAVMLCTMMVLVVISVMGGWLRMFENSFRGLSGDIVVEGDLAGFANYEEMIARIEQLPSIEAAVPIVKSYGLINIDDQKITAVQMEGIWIKEIGRVNEFPKSLWRGYHELEEQSKDPSLSEADRAKLRAEAEKRAKDPSFDKPFKPEFYRELRGWEEGKSRGMDPALWPPLIGGAGVFNIHKNKDGVMEGRDEGLYTLPVKVTVLGVSRDKGIDLNSKAERTYWIVDDSRTEVWQYDNNYVYVPFDILQADLGMTESTAIDKATNKEIKIPARTSEIHIRTKPAWRERPQLDQAKMQVDDIVQEVFNAHTDRNARRLARPPLVQTWRESQSLWLDAIQNEKLLTVFLFAIISVVAIFLIFCIFYMIVAEKTRDIGIIKSVGATPGGVAGIFLGYGAVIGIVGAGLGLLLSYMLVTYINEIHTWMGRTFHLQIWNPEVYLFDKIPNTMKMSEVIVIVSIAILASILGALVPAIRAARMNPVEALRWE